MKLLITGGHLTPAIAVVEKIINSDLKNQVTIVFVGRKYQFETEKSLSLEYQEIKIKGIKFIPLNAGRLTRYISIRTLRSVIKIPGGFYQAWQILKEEKPDKILTFGGYLALPIAIISFFLKIPVFTHEQTINPGLANRIIGIFSKKVFLAFEETKKYFPSKKIIVTGNPIRQSISKIIKKPFKINKDRPVIYITGGSLGSHSINIHISKILTELLIEFIIIHQTGDTKEYNDYDRLIKQKNLLPERLKYRYYIKKHFFDDEIGYIYSLTDLLIGRAGANTFFELLELNIPAVFVPLPWAANQEQQRHAEIFKRNGTGEIYSQFASSDELLSLIKSTMININRYKKNFTQLEIMYKKNATDAIIKEILVQ